jgi:acyl-coenzyme A thioesterase PaaI-like protein
MKTLDIYQRLIKLPLGHRLFSKAICFNAPYFSSIKPQIQMLKPGFCQVHMKKRRRVQNHLKTVHAIAMCNMAELSAGLMTEVSVANGSRWIPAGMEVQYLKKAKTHLTAVADGSAIDWSQPGEVIVPVAVTDAKNELVFIAQVRMSVKHNAKY